MPTSPNAPLRSSSVDDDEHTRLRVVFLDDEPMMRGVFVEAAAGHGIRATAVSSVTELRSELRGSKADLAVLDFHLGDGETSAELVRELVTSGALVVVWTGDADAAREALGDAMPVVSKGPDTSLLFKQVARLIHARASALAAAVESGDLDAP